MQSWYDNTSQNKKKVKSIVGLTSRGIDPLTEVSPIIRNSKVLIRSLLEARIYENVLLSRCLQPSQLRC
jgi:hypothetical protein